MVYSAVSLDVPLDNAEKLNISIRLTDEQRERLNLLAEIEGISLEEAAKSVLLEELNSE